MRKLLLLLSMIVVIFFISCQKKASWDRHILAPLLNTHLDVGDIFGDTNVQENSDQSWSLIVKQNLNLLATNKVINMDDTISVDLFNIPFTFTIPPGQKVIEKQNVTPLNFKGMELKMARASVARMKFYVTNTIKQPLLVNYKLYSATLNGLVYEITTEVPAASDTAKAFVVKDIDLDNYNIDLTGPNGDAYNTIYATTTVWIHPDGDTAIVAPTDSVLIVSTFDEFKPAYARGYLGEQQFDTRGAEAIGAFGNFKSGSFDIKKVKASIDIYNFIGAELSIGIDQLATKRNSPPSIVNLNNPIVGSIINMQRAAESNLAEYLIYPRHKHYNLTNSNIDRMIEIMPDSLLFHISAVMNPLGNISAGNDFIYFNKGLEANLKLNIPLDFSANNLLIEDNSPIHIEDKKVKSGAVTIYIENLFPFSVNIQFYLLDANNLIVDSLLQRNTLIAAGQMDNSSGVVMKASNTRLPITLSSSLLTNLGLAEKIKIKARINTIQNQSYQLYMHYGMNVKIVGDMLYGE